MKRKIIKGFRASLPKAGGLALGVMLTLPAFSVVESIELNNATLPGTVLLDNHRYVVNGTVTISASNNFATSALRVRAGTSAIIDIKKDATLNVCGGPGYGQLPGGAGIEVPSGAKLVVCGDGTLNAWGGGRRHGLRRHRRPVFGMCDFA